MLSNRTVSVIITELRMAIMFRPRLDLHVSLVFVLRSTNRSRSRSRSTWGYLMRVSATVFEFGFMLFMFFII